MLSELVFYVHRCCYVMRSDRIRDQVTLGIDIRYLCILDLVDKKVKFLGKSKFLEIEEFIDLRTRARPPETPCYANIRINCACPYDQTPASL